MNMYLDMTTDISTLASGMRMYYGRRNFNEKVFMKYMIDDRSLNTTHVSVSRPDSWAPYIEDPAPIPMFCDRTTLINDERARNVQVAKEVI